MINQIKLLHKQKKKRKITPKNDKTIPKTKTIDKDKNNTIPKTKTNTISKTKNKDNTTLDKINNKKS